MAKKQTNPAELNSSYTVFFLIAALGLAFVLAPSSEVVRNVSTVILVLYTLLLYFMWDFIKQLYSTGQSIFLYAVTFIILPTFMNFTLQYPYGRFGAIIFIGSIIIAGVLEFIYEILIKHRLPKPAFKRFLGLDNKVDQSLIKFSDQHLALNDYKGLVSATLLIVLFYTLSFLLIHR